MESVHERVQRLIHKNLSSENRLHGLLCDLLEEATEALHGNGGLIFLCDSEGCAARCVAVYNTAQDYSGLMLQYGEGVAGEIAELGSPLNIKNYQQWTGRPALFEETPPFGPVLGVPMKLQNEVIGVIQLLRSEGEAPFTGEDLETLQQISSQVALAINNIRLTDRIQNQLAFQGILNQMSDMAASTPRLSELLETALAKVLQLLAAQMGMVKIQNYRVQQGFQLTPGAVLDRSFQEEHDEFWGTLVFENRENDLSPTSILAEAVEQLGIRAAILVPIEIEKKQDGFIGVCSAFPRKWSQEEIRMVETIGKQISLMVERELISRKVRLQAFMMENLRWVGNTLSRFVTLEDMIGAIGHGVLKLSSPDRAAIYLQSRKEGISCRWSFNLSAGHATGLGQIEGQKLGQKLLGRVKPLLIPDTLQGKVDPIIKQFADGEQIRGLHVWPLVYDENVVGAIGCYFDQPREISQIDYEAMAIFSNQASVAIQSAWLYEQIEKNYVDMAFALADAMEARDRLLAAEENRLVNLVEKIALEMGCADQELQDILWAARLHDIGKTTVPDAVLRKPGPLTNEEWAVVQKHPLEGERFIRPISGFRKVSTIVRNCREHYDGSGYPDGLKGSEIPLGARILAVADAYTSMVEERPYRKPMTHTQAMLELRRRTGKQFDPQVVEMLVKELGD